MVNRIESLSITQWHGMAKVLGAVTCLSGAMVITFYKGPALYSEYGKEASHNSSRTYTKEEWIKGSLLMLGANLTWAIWLIMQVLSLYFFFLIKFFFLIFPLNMY